jgi:spoIIIJ-associated protein
MTVDFVEVRGKTVDIAVAAAMQELGVEDREHVQVDVVQEPEKGVLGLFGGKDAIVRVTLRPDGGKRRRRRRRKGGEGRDGDRHQEQRQPRSETKPRQGGQGGRNGQRQGQGGGRDGQRQQRSGGRGGGQGSSAPRPEPKPRPKEREEREVSIEEQIPVVSGFLSGLVGAFGLEGEVKVSADGDVIVADVVGQQTESMVGPRGSVIEAIHELTKTVLHRQTQSSARLRLDIAGYAERRRQALAIYAGQLIAQVLEDGGEVMLEPMSAADRKVIHDAVAARDGVRSYSEGEAPQRYVVIAREVSASDLSEQDEAQAEEE